MLSRECDQTLSRGIALASARHHASLTVETLFLALLDDSQAGQALLACGADIEDLRFAATAPLDDEPSGSEGEGPRPDRGVERILARAEMHCQAAGRDEVTGANLLVALLSERDSEAASLLAGQGIMREDLVEVILRARATPVLGPALESTIRRAMAVAHTRHHEEATLDHLLLALIDDPDAGDALRKCGANLESLRSVVTAYLDRTHEPYPYEARPAVGLQQIIQRAAAHVRDLGKSKITGANILVELFSDPDTWAVRCLAEQGIGRLQVVGVIMDQRDDLREPT